MNQKTKNLFSLLAVLIIGYLIAAYYLNFWPAKGIKDRDLVTNNQNVVCAQVITFAVNPDTGKIEDFSTPCDVPDGWVVVEADIIKNEDAK